MNNVVTTSGNQLMTVEDGVYHFPKEVTIKQIIEAIPSASEREVIDNLKIMFASMPTRDQSGAEAQIAAMGYLMALDAAPLYAVQGAVKAFIRGEVEGQHETFRPSPATFSKEVRRQIFLKVRRERLVETEASHNFTQEQLDQNKKRAAQIISGEAS
jgi:hypothetical protein